MTYWAQPAQPQPMQGSFPVAPQFQQPQQPAFWPWIRPQMPQPIQTPWNQATQFIQSAPAAIANVQQQAQQAANQFQEKASQVALDVQRVPQKIKNEKPKGLWPLISLKLVNAVIAAKTAQHVYNASFWATLPGELGLGLLAAYLLKRIPEAKDPISKKLMLFSNRIMRGPNVSDPKALNADEKGKCLIPLAGLIALFSGAINLTIGGLSIVLRTHNKEKKNWGEAFKSFGSELQTHNITSLKAKIEKFIANDRIKFFPEALQERIATFAQSETKTKIFPKVINGLKRTLSGDGITRFLGGFTEFGNKFFTPIRSQIKALLSKDLFTKILEGAKNFEIGFNKIPKPAIFIALVTLGVVGGTWEAIATTYAARHQPKALEKLTKGIS